MKWIIKKVIVELKWLKEELEWFLTWCKNTALVKWWKNAPWFQVQQPYIRPEIGWQVMLVNGLREVEAISKPPIVARIVDKFSDWWRGGWEQKSNYDREIYLRSYPGPVFPTYQEAEAFGDNLWEDAAKPGIFGKDYYIKSV